MCHAGQRQWTAAAGLDQAFQVLGASGWAWSERIHFFVDLALGTETFIDDGVLSFPRLAWYTTNSALSSFSFFARGRLPHGDIAQDLPSDSLAIVALSLQFAQVTAVRVEQGEASILQLAARFCTLLPDTRSRPQRAITIVDVIVSIKSALRAALVQLGNLKGPKGKTLTYSKSSSRHKAYRSHWVDRTDCYSQAVAEAPKSLPLGRVPYPTVSHIAILCALWSFPAHVSCLRDRCVAA